MTYCSICEKDGACFCAMYKARRVVTELRDEIKQLKEFNNHLEAEMNNPINFMHGDHKLMFHPRESIEKVQSFTLWLMDIERDAIEYKKRFKNVLGGAFDVYGNPISEEDYK